MADSAGNIDKKIANILSGTAAVGLGFRELCRDFGYLTNPGFCLAGRITGALFILYGVYRLKGGIRSQLTRRTVFLVLVLLVLISEYKAEMKYMQARDRQGDVK